MNTKATVIVSGGTGGLGRAVVASLVTAGWRVVVPHRPGSSANHPSGDIVPVPADLSIPEDARRVAAEAVTDAQRPLRAVVNLIGGFSMGGRVHETPVGEFDRMLELNLRSVYLLCHAAVPSLLSAGGGSITTISSQSAKKPFSGAAGYISSKAAVLAFTDALAAEYGREGIRCNALLPGVIDTPANRAGQPDADPQDWVKPEAIASVVTFLSSDAGAAISGAHIPVEPVRTASL